MSQARPFLLLSALCAVTVAAVTACREEPAETPKAAAALATVEPPKPPKPPPPKQPPRPTLTAVFVGDVAAKLLSAGAATAAPAPAAAEPAKPPSAAGADAGPQVAKPPPPARALVAAPVISREPHERPDDEPWVLPEAPTQLLWRHPAPAAGLQLELLEARGRSWPTRVRVEPVGDARLATLTALEPLPPGASFRLVARVLAADGHSQLWTEPLKVQAPAP